MIRGHTVKNKRTGEIITVLRILAEKTQENNPSLNVEALKADFVCEANVWYLVQTKYGKVELNGDQITAFSVMDLYDLRDKSYADLDIVTFMGCQDPWELKELADEELNQLESKYIVLVDYEQYITSTINKWRELNGRN